MLFKFKNEDIRTTSFTCEHMSRFVLIAGFERANVCWVHIERRNTFDDKIDYLIRYFAIFLA